MLSPMERKQAPRRDSRKELRRRLEQGKRRRADELLARRQRTRRSK